MAREAAVGRSRGYLKDYDTDIGDGGPHNYRDNDDHLIFAHYGHRATASQRHAVTVIVNRYFRLAAAGDGSKACAMLLPAVAKVAHLDYGRYGAWSALHTAKTCAEVLTRLFKHYRHQLAAPVEVTGVLIKGDHAYALLGSTRFRAGFISLREVKGAWLMGGLLGGAII